MYQIGRLLPLKAVSLYIGFPNMQGSTSKNKTRRKLKLSLKPNFGIHHHEVLPIIKIKDPPNLASTTKKVVFYDTYSRTVINNRLRMCHGGIFVIRCNLFSF